MISKELRGEVHPQSGHRHPIHVAYYEALEEAG